jgi:hypothetical protein
VKGTKCFRAFDELVADERLELATLGAFGQTAEYGVPEPARQWVGELGGLVDAAGHSQDGIGTRSADRLVLGERGGEVTAPCEPIGENDGILGRCAAPCPTPGVVACAASPTRTMRPSFQRGSGSS